MLNFEALIWDFSFHSPFNIGRSMFISCVGCKGCVRGREKNKISPLPPEITFKLEVGVYTPLRGAYLVVPDRGDGG
jgi:hypothetical protein